MKPTLSFTVRQSDFTALQNDPKGNTSKFFENAFKDLIAGRITVTAEDFNSVKTSCCLDGDLAMKVQEIAESLGVPVSKLARIVAEKTLHTH